MIPSSVKTDDEIKEPNWAGSNENANFGAFGKGLGEGTTFKSEALFSGNSATVNDLNGLSPATRKPEEVKWFYRDPSGQVQGPFEAQAMQDWYKAGFFAPSLMLRRDDEAIFEPLLMLIQKVGNEDQPFLTPRPLRNMSNFPGGDMFGSPEKSASLFRNNPEMQPKYMPFSSGGPSGAVPTTPGGSVLGSFLGNNLPTSPLYQNPYGGGYGGSLLRDNRWNNADQATPSWLNPGSNDLFGAPNNPLGASPFLNHQQPALNPMFGSNINSSGLFDYQRPLNDPMDQQYNYLLQQKQQQQPMQFQQQFSQAQLQQDFQLQPSQEQQQMPSQDQLLQEEQPRSQSPQQNDFKNSPLENITNISTGAVDSNHASPIMRSNLMTNNWGSVPGTPVATETPSSPWGSLVSTAAIPNKVSEELQFKAPGAQSPHTPSSPKKPIEKPVKAIKTIVESFADIQLEEEKKAAAAKAAKEAMATVYKDNNTDLDTKPTTSTSMVKPTTANTASKASSIVEESSSKYTPPTVIPKPVVSLREIQEEELRLAKEKKAKEAAAAAASAAMMSSNWSSSNNASSTTATSATSAASNASVNTWSQPTQKPPSLREIQEMEVKQAAEAKKASAAQYLAQQEQLANSTPSTLSWGVVVPNTKLNASSNHATNATSSSASTTAQNAATAAWTAPTGPKKTLREIQQEEELAMKKKAAKAATKTAAAIAAANATNTIFTSATKTYAVPSSANAGGAWTTVTHTRAPKPSPAPASAATPPPAAAPRAPARPVAKAPVRATPVRPSGPSEDFRRWCKKALRDLNSGVNQEEIISMLISFPVDASCAEIIEDVIYANSLRIDGKRFAQEFMKRRKADIAGRLDIVTAGLEEDDIDDFQVVVTKKNKKKASA
ncbi:MAG: hypothetical protein EXX96DRAFT_568313 [Benjaminiella poitrasii]|nr:MAG: hypothetical protein EXX96DRAFT_568313 [Benjaminiella poitrasii]